MKRYMGDVYYKFITMPNKIPLLKISKLQLFINKEFGHKFIFSLRHNKHDVIRYQI